MDTTDTANKAPIPAKESTSLTLEEIKMRQMVTSMKIAIEKQKIMATILPSSSHAETVATPNFRRFEGIIEYATIAIAAFRMAKKVITFLKNFKK